MDKFFWGFILVWFVVVGVGGFGVDDGSDWIYEGEGFDGGFGEGWFEDFLSFFDGGFEDGFGGGGGEEDGRGEVGDGGDVFDGLVECFGDGDVGDFDDFEVGN